MYYWFAFLCAFAAVGSAGPAFAKSKSHKHKQTSKHVSHTTATGTPSSELSALANEVQGAKNKTFKATWTTSSTSSTAGAPTTVTLEQKPPDSLFLTSGGSGGGEFLSLGTTSYFCGGSSGAAETCLKEAGPNPLASLIDLYSGDTFASALQGYESEVAAKVAGVNVKFSNQSFVGQSGKCLTVTANGQTLKWCVTDSGILAYASVAGHGTFQLTSYSTSVSGSDFKLPSGAKIETLP